MVLACLLPSGVRLLFQRLTIASQDIQEKWRPIGNLNNLNNLNNVRGKATTPFITSRRIDELSNGTFLHKDGDIWVTTYPKAGTHWTQQIVNLLNDYPGNTTVFDHCPWPEPELSWLARSIEELNAIPKSPYGIRCFKTHWVYDDHMANVDLQVIYVMRNAMDTVVSFYHHFLHLNFIYEFDGSWEEFFELFISGDVDNGNYFDHIASWWPHKDESRVLFLRYEDMKNNNAGSIRRIANFMNISLSEQKLAVVLEKSSLKFMKQVENDDIFNKILFKLGVLKGNFIRKGIVGDSKGYFTISQYNALLEQYNQKLKPLGVPIDWCLHPLSG